MTTHYSNKHRQQQRWQRWHHSAGCCHAAVTYRHVNKGFLDVGRSPRGVRWSSVSHFVCGRSSLSPRHCVPRVKALQSCCCRARIWSPGAPGTFLHTAGVESNGRGRPAVSGGIQIKSSALTCCNDIRRVSGTCRHVNGSRPRGRRQRDERTCISRCIHDGRRHVVCGRASARGLRRDGSTAAKRKRRLGRARARYYR